MERDEIALNVLLKCMNRVKDQEMNDELIKRVVNTAFAITDEFIGQRLLNAGSGRPADSGR